MLTRTSKGLLTLAVAVAALIALSGCFQAPITVTRADDGTVQTISIGDTLVVALEGNASTGYQWIRTEPTSINGDPLDAISEGDYVDHSPDACGGPGTFSFTYEAVTTGVVTLTYTYRRPWEDEIIETVSFVIWVK